jgi:hypothetical protein
MTYVMSIHDIMEVPHETRRTVAGLGYEELLKK